MTAWGTVVYIAPVIGVYGKPHVFAVGINPRGQVVYDYVTWVPHTGATGQPSTAAVLVEQAAPDAGPPRVT
jgi:hypothetical protein